VVQRAKSIEESIKKNTNQRVTVDSIISGTNDLKGWARTSRRLEPHGEYGEFRAVYTRDPEELIVYVESSMGDGTVWGVYSDGTGKKHTPSFVKYLHTNRETLEQTYMESSPNKKGIGSLLCHEGALFAKSQGYRYITVSMANQNSAALLRRFNPESESTPLLGSGGGGSCCDSCCFLVTACAEVRGLPADCEELTILREFRDGYLSKDGDRQAMVDLYYEIAPAIVDALRASPDPGQEFEAIYLAIRECVELIQGRDFEAALRLYATMVKKLADRFPAVRLG